MKILVTGGAGFIGSHVIKALLDRGDEIVCFDNFNDYYDPQLKRDRIDVLLKDYQFEVVEGNISNKAKLEAVFESHQFDAICHLAAQAGVRYSIDHPDTYIQSNTLGTHNILEAARHHNVTRLVLASSSSVYGGNTKIPFSEDDPVNEPVSLYAATKRSNELEAYTYHHLYGLNIFALRFFTVYGPWGRPDMAAFKFVKAILNDEKIDVYNNGEMKRDFTYVDDIVAGVLASLDKCKGFEIINLGNHQPVELEQFISVIEETLEKKAEKNYMPLQPGDVLSTYADISKAQKVLKWEPTTNIEAGMRAFVDWYKDYYKIK